MGMLGNWFSWELGPGNRRTGSLILGVDVIRVVYMPLKRSENGIFLKNLDTGIITFFDYFLTLIHSSNSILLVGSTIKKNDFP